jgi:hypothetical protein
MLFFASASQPADAALTNWWHAELPSGLYPHLVAPSVTLQSQDGAESTIVTGRETQFVERQQDHAHRVQERGRGMKRPASEHLNQRYVDSNTKLLRTPIPPR